MQIKDRKIDVEKIKAALKKSKCNGSPGLKEIEERLADDKTYVNAEMLLNENHPLRLRQVEDEQSYFAVRESILKLVNTGKDSCDLPGIKSELDYLQERRTADLLQRIPGIVDDEFRQGNIKAKKAIFTIGLAHIHKIIEYLNKGRIDISPSLFNSGQRLQGGVELTERKFRRYRHHSKNPDRGPESVGNERPGQDRYTIEEPIAHRLFQTSSIRKQAFPSPYLPRNHASLLLKAYRLRSLCTCRVDLTYRKGLSDHRLQRLEGQSVAGEQGDNVEDADLGMAELW